MSAWPHNTRAAPTPSANNDGGGASPPNRYRCAKPSSWKNLFTPKSLTITSTGAPKLCFEQNSPKAFGQHHTNV